MYLTPEKREFAHDIVHVNGMTHVDDYLRLLHKRDPVYAGQRFAGHMMQIVINKVQDALRADGMEWSQQEIGYGRYNVYRTENAKKPVSKDVQAHLSYHLSARVSLPLYRNNTNPQCSTSVLRHLPFIADMFDTLKTDLDKSTGQRHYLSNLLQRDKSEEDMVQLAEAFYEQNYYDPYSCQPYNPGFGFEPLSDEDLNKTGIKEQDLSDLAQDRYCPFRKHELDDMTLDGVKRVIGGFIQERDPQLFQQKPELYQQLFGAPMPSVVAPAPDIVVPQPAQPPAPPTAAPVAPKRTWWRSVADDLTQGWDTVKQGVQQILQPQKQLSSEDQASVADPDATPEKRKPKFRPRLVQPEMTQISDRQRETYHHFMENKFWMFKRGTGQALQFNHPDNTRLREMATVLRHGNYGVTLDGREIEAVKFRGGKGGRGVTMFDNTNHDAVPLDKDASYHGLDTIRVEVLKELQLYAAKMHQDKTGKVTSVNMNTAELKKAAKITNQMFVMTAKRLRLNQEMDGYARGDLLEMKGGQIAAMAHGIYQGVRSDLQTADTFSQIGMEKGHLSRWTFKAHKTVAAFGAGLRPGVENLQKQLKHHKSRSHVLDTYDSMMAQSVKKRRDQEQAFIDQAYGMAQPTKRQPQRQRAMS